MKFNNFFKITRQIFLMSTIDFKSGFKASVLSWFWVVINPLLMVAIYLFTFFVSGQDSSKIELIKYDSNDLWKIGDIPLAHEYNRIGWLIIGVFTWTYVGSILISGSSSIKNYSWMVTKIGSPMYSPPIFVAISKSYIGIPTIIVSWIIYMIICGVDPISSDNQVISINILQLPLIIILLFLFMMFWSIFISPLSAISKDVFNFIVMLPMFLQWVTGVFLPVSSAKYNEWSGIIFRVNPFNFLIEGIRGAIIGNSFFWNDWVSLVSFFGFFLLFISLSIFLMKRSKKIVVDLV